LHVIKRESMRNKKVPIHVDEDESRSRPAAETAHRGTLLSGHPRARRRMPIDEADRR